MDYFFWFASDGERHLDKEVLIRFEEILGLTFSPANNENINVCFIDSEQLRDEYKSTFNLKDISNYVGGVRAEVKLSLQGNYYEVPYPSDDITFWRLARLGKQSGARS